MDDTKALSRLSGLAALCLVMPLLASCTGGGADLAGAADVDRSLSTSSIPPRDKPIDNPDALTVRNAVSSADIATTGTSPIPWANSASGSAGVITGIDEEQVNGTTCRRFATTRHSYQGIAQFTGNACLLGNGEWYLTSFAPRS